MGSIGSIFKKKCILLTLLCISVLIIFVGCGKKPNSATVSIRQGSAIKNASGGSATDGEEPTLTIVEKLYVIEDLNMSDETIALYDIEDNKQLRFNYNMTTVFKDKYGNNCSCVNFPSGSVVSIGDKLPSSGALSEVKMSDAVWVYADVTKYTVDDDRGVFETGGSNYKLTAKTKIYSDNERISATDLGANDTLTVTGTDKEIISIYITSGHGFVHLSNTQLFDGSLIFIGNKIVTQVDGDSVLEIPEGQYDITVANDGWGGTAPFTVIRGETTEVNLDSLKGEGPSYSDITFLVTVPDTYVYVDGKLIDTNEIQQIRYGSHKLVVNCNGYSSWNKTLVVNSESATITLAMEEEKQQETSEKTEETDETASDSSEQKSEVDESKDKEKASSTDDYDYEKDYLSTIQDMLSSLMN